MACILFRTDSVIIHETKYATTAVKKVEFKNFVSSIYLVEYIITELSDINRNYSAEEIQYISKKTRKCSTLSDKTYDLIENSTRRERGISKL